jgi:hypothetical protein
LQELVWGRTSSCLSSRVLGLQAWTITPSYQWIYSLITSITPTEPGWLMSVHGHHRQAPHTCRASTQFRKEGFGWKEAKVGKFNLYLTKNIFELTLLPEWRSTIHIFSILSSPLYFQKLWFMKRLQEVVLFCLDLVVFLV